jgi:hypothetical protein
MSSPLRHVAGKRPAGGGAKNTGSAASDILTPSCVRGSAGRSSTRCVFQLVGREVTPRRRSLGLLGFAAEGFTQGGIEMVKNIASEVKRNGESWRSKSGPVQKQIERVFPAGRSQPADQAPHGGYLQRRGGDDG